MPRQHITRSTIDVIAGQCGGATLVGGAVCRDRDLFDLALIMLAVLVVRALRHRPAERLAVSVGASLLIGLVFGAAVVGEWRAGCVNTGATLALATSDGLGTVAEQTTPFHETIAGKVFALTEAKSDPTVAFELARCVLGVLP